MKVKEVCDLAEKVIPLVKTMMGEKEVSEISGDVQNIVVLLRGLGVLK